MGRPGNDPVGLAQPVDEPCTGHHDGAASGEETLGRGHPLLGEQQVATQAAQQPPPAAPADDVAGVVTADRRQHASASTATRFNCPVPAYNPAAIRIVWPGRGTPKPSTPTRTMIAA
ncbi:hypothetical protein [Mycobacterium ostraviense]|uniref:hypothetical protein n=1 Tax=Mycobacterium ostraviense TaxID=2738409 RepID=UPI001912A608|nr:hypothetical protein [Mycobacterium ostraviense]